MADLFLALLHHPVLDKNGLIVTSAVTNMDIHDIARTACTYGVRRFFVVTPVRALRALSERILEHWETGFGSTYNETRKEALSLAAVAPDLDDVLIAIERETGQRPVIVVTSARADPESLGYAALRERLARDNSPYLLLFGTGWGLSPEIMQRADLRLAPILGPTPYNHLSVRSAAAIILDRLYGAR
ncbi:MAG: RNA methyltransferase [Candidatus Binatia bacterium]